MAYLFSTKLATNFDLLWKNYGTVPKTLELRFTKEKNMVDYQTLWNFDL